MKNLLLAILVSFSFLTAYSQELVQQFNKTVTFLYSFINNELKPHGTAFLVSIPAKNQKGNYIYLVTAKHVLHTENKQKLNVIYAKFNTKDSSEMFTITLNWTGQNKTVFTHADTSIDLAIIPIVVPSNLEYKHIRIDQIIKRSDFDSLKVNVGTDVFFTGLFTAYIGTKSINPIFRFGKICLIPREKIEFDKVNRELLLVESSSFGGNSGSPVICQFQNKGSTHVRLAGVVLGSFNQGQILAKGNNQDIIAWSSIGISAITPSDFILEILNIAELENKRKK